MCGAKDQSSRSFAVVFLSSRVVPIESYVFFRIKTHVMGGGIDRLSPFVLSRFSGWCLFALASGCCEILFSQLCVVWSVDRV